MSERERDGHGHGSHGVEVQVNGKVVVLDNHRVTGLEIKEAAVAKGVIPDVGFQLSEERQNGELVVVRDDQVITITKHSRFLAVAPDDNS